MTVRGYKRAYSWICTRVIENLTDRFYQEHLDFRTGRGIFRHGLVSNQDGNCSTKFGIGILPVVQQQFGYHS